MRFQACSWSVMLFTLLLLADLIGHCRCRWPEGGAKSALAFELQSQARRVAGNEPRRGRNLEELVEQVKVFKEEEEEAAEEEKNRRAQRLEVSRGSADGAQIELLHYAAGPARQRSVPKRGLSETGSIWSWLNWLDRPYQPYRRANPPSMWGRQCGQTLYDQGTMEGYSGDGDLVWEPAPDRFLFMHCSQGKISRRIKCIQNHLLYAGLLQRTLLVPMDPSEVVGGYDYRAVFDLEHFRACYGRDAVMTTAEYAKEHRENVTIDQLFCWTTKDEACPLREGVDEAGAQHRFLRREEFSHPIRLLKTAEFAPTTKLHVAYLGRQALLEEFLSRFKTARGKVLFLGDMLSTSIAHTPKLYSSGDIPFLRHPACPNSLAVQPHKAFFWAAQKFIKEFLKGEFVAVHLRRADFVSHCQIRDCAFPVPQVAECTRDKLAETNLTTIYLATDGDEKDVRNFKEVAHEVNGREIKIVRFPEEINVKGWASPLVRYKFASKSGQEKIDPLVLATLEKVICAHSAIFLGSMGSYFSTDIERLRYGLGTATCEDRFACDADPPWAKDDFRLQPFLEENRGN